MNLMHIKYATVVAETGSINKAAEKLLIGQPNLSRAIKELEASLGVTIFDRSARGMRLTPEGEIFMGYAKSILKQVDAVENVFKKDRTVKKRFSVSVPRASYISEAFTNFTKHLDGEDEVEVFYKETNAMRTINNVLQDDYKLGIIRYAKAYDKYYKNMMELKGLNCEVITEFKYILVMSRCHPLANREKIVLADLQPFTEIAHPDPFVPSLSLSEVRHDELAGHVRKRLFIFERGSQFDLLSHNTHTFMWASPIPEEQLTRYGLVMKPCEDNDREYKDVMIYNKNYSLSPLDDLFIFELCKSKRRLFGESL
ncbi:MAG TPA: LysR family transcriptional regulator [Ruminococcaceae bacterium]|nr:LysR family transcriptional regulator [Oscillospiraceae bacterium]